MFKDKILLQHRRATAAFRTSTPPQFWFPFTATWRIWLPCTSRRVLRFIASTTARSVKRKYEEWVAEEEEKVKENWIPTTI